MTQLVGTAPNQVSVNGLLGTMAFQDAEAVKATLTHVLPAVAEPVNASEMTFELASDTSLVIRVRGSDGTVRSATITLA
jgi:hypothetical protein